MAIEFQFFRFSNREKNDLQHTVEVMVDLGLTYSQTKNVDGTYQYQIEPDINCLCNFKCKNVDASREQIEKKNISFSVNERTNELTYSNMQIIAREVELETMRRSAPKQNSNKATITTTTSKQAIVKPKPQNHLQRLNMKGVKAKTKDTVCIHFRFNEGAICCCLCFEISTFEIHNFLKL